MNNYPWHSKTYLEYAYLFMVLQYEAANNTIYSYTKNKKHAHFVDLCVDVMIAIPKAIVYTYLFVYI